MQIVIRMKTVAQWRKNTPRKSSQHWLLLQCVLCQSVEIRIDVNVWFGATAKNGELIIVVVVVVVVVWLFCLLFVVINISLNELKRGYLWSQQSMGYYVCQLDQARSLAIEFHNSAGFAPN